MPPLFHTGRFVVDPPVLLLFIGFLLVGQARTALHDIWVLSLVDDAVLTPRSTFGYHAMALKVPHPYPFPYYTPHLPHL